LSDANGGLDDFCGHIQIGFRFWGRNFCSLQPAAWVPFFLGLRGLCAGFYPAVLGSTVLFPLFEQLWHGVACLMCSFPN